jgi:hypothetical protein
MVEPDSSYSHLELHICWNVNGDDKVEPSIRAECLRSAIRKHTYAENVLPGIEVIFYDAWGSGIMDAAGLLHNERWLELAQFSRWDSEELPVYNDGAGLVILTFGTPHLLECARGR